MPNVTFNAAFASCNRALAHAQPSTAEPDSNSLSHDCAECIELKEQISAHKRTVDELTEENKRSRNASEDLDAKIAALRDLAKREQRAADETANQIRAERDSLQARLTGLEQVGPLRTSVVP